MNRKYFVKISITLNILFLFSLLILCIKFDIPDKIAAKVFKVYNLTNTSSESNARSALFNMLPINENDIVFLGDSLMARCEWNEAFNNQQIKNRGISGDTTIDIQKRLESIQAPDKVFLMVGINDLLKQRTVESTFIDYKKIIENIQIKSSSIDIYIESLLPTNMKSINLKIKDLKSLLKKYADKNNIIYIDLYNAFLDNENLLRKEYTFDGVHLTNTGYLLWIELLSDYIS